MNTTTTITNETNGIITKVTIFHQAHLDYRWLILAILVSVLLAWGLRKMFWEDDSN